MIVGAGDSQRSRHRRARPRGAPATSTCCRAEQISHDWLDSRPRASRQEVLIGEKM
jgi:hypothetical protein